MSRIDGRRGHVHRTDSPQTHDIFRNRREPGELVGSSYSPALADRSLTYSPSRRLYTSSPGTDARRECPRTMQYTDSCGSTTVPCVAKFRSPTNRMRRSQQHNLLPQRSPYKASASPRYTGIRDDRYPRLTARWVDLTRWCARNSCVASRSCQVQSRRSTVPLEGPGLGVDAHIAYGPTSWRGASAADTRLDTILSAGDVASGIGPRKGWRGSPTQMSLRAAAR